MHGSSLRRMRWFVEIYLSGVAEKLKVLDIGSCDVAGGTYRQFFEPARFDYVGLDMAPGPNVDIVPKHPYFWKEISAGSFDIVISGQAFEHMEYFWLTAAEMARVLKPDGLMCVIAPRGFARHRYPVDCYRFDADGMVAIARWCNLRPLHVSTDMAPCGAGSEWHIEDCEDSMLVARKPHNWPGILNPEDYVFAEADMTALQTGFIPCEKIRIPVALMAEYRERESALKQKAAKLAEQNLDYERELAKKNAELEYLKKQVWIFENSNSWRITRPLRVLRKAARRMFP